ncbi:hypothetical protein AB0L44_46710 [Nonomuraea wenchangensis]|uniref:hypothetical protein n=1 Tax=Nonomuraea wenchangensis TaxID=568860 RepID=UPI00344717ED
MQLDPIIQQLYGHVVSIERECVRLRDAVRPQFLQLNLEWPLEPILDELIERSRSLPRTMADVSTLGGRERSKFSFKGGRIGFDPALAERALADLAAVQEAAEQVDRYLLLLRMSVEAADSYLRRAKAASSGSFKPYRGQFPKRR